MRIGRRGRRSALAAGLAAAIAATAGCRWVPVRRIEPPAAALPEPGEPANVLPDAALPPLPELRSISDDEAFRVGSPTPLLDAAAARDAAVKRAVATPTLPTTPEPVPVLEGSEATPTPPATSGLPVFEVPPRAEEPGAGGGTEAPLAEVPPPARPPADESEPQASAPVGREDAAGAKPRAGSPPEESQDGHPRPLDPPPKPGDPGLWETVMAALATPDATPTLEPLATPPGPGFSISEMRFCRKVLGFARTEPLSTESCRPGQEVLIYCELEGLRDEEGEAGFRSRLSARLQILPKSGGAPIWQVELGEQVDVCRRRRRDFFASYRLRLPEGLRAGAYEIRLVQKDLLAEAETSRALPLTIRP